MRSSKSTIFLLTTLLAITVSLINAKSIEKREAKPDYFQNTVNELELIKKIPILSEFVGPYVSSAQNLILQIDKLTDHSLSAIVNSIMPCRFKDGSIKCEGNVDQASVRKLLKKLLTFLPVDMLPPPVAAIIKLMSDMA